MTGRPNDFAQATLDGRIGGAAQAVAPQVSFEFFPPKTPEMERTLWQSVKRLEPLGPEFVSVTYGAGGNTRERTHNLVVRILKETDLVPAAHLTCIGASRDEVDDVARAYWQAGVRHIVALRGDPPKDATGFEAHPQGYANAAELIAGLKAVADFEISAAAYPEVHTEAVSAKADLDFLKRKIDAGASRAITQIFFDGEVYLRWLERVRKTGIDVPIVPGIMPVTNFKGAVRFAKGCGATIPDWMAHLFEGLDDDAETRKLLGATIAAEQCRRLQDAGIHEFHFYTLNRADLTYAICHILGLRGASSVQREALVRQG